MSQDDETIRIYDARATDYASMVAKPRPDAEVLGFLADLPPNASILDLGCGPGTSASHFARAGHAVDAMDASAQMVALAGQHKGVTAWQGTFDQMPTGCHYHGVWANFSLLHASRAELPRYLMQIHDMLHPAGIFHIGMKLGEGTHRDRLGRLYTYFSEDALSAMLTTAGFTITARTHGNEPGLSGEPADWICLRAHA
ncbi:MAG: class I SAM-dependent methyltransferase [Rhodobacteraceae bacterium]|nr:class I SAM-dependent methyltransferase [Paracoccaceae bacterium]